MSPKLVELFLPTEQQIQLLELYFGGEILHGIQNTTSILNLYFRLNTG